MSLLDTQILQILNPPIQTHQHRIKRYKKRGWEPHHLDCSEFRSIEAMDAKINTAFATWCMNGINNKYYSKIFKYIEFGSMNYQSRF